MRLKIIATLVVIIVLATLLWPTKTESAKVFRGEAIKAIYATGTVEPTVMAYLSPKISAKLVELLVDEGSRVQKGSLLARLDDSQERANLLELEAKEILADQELKRVKSLLDKKAVSMEVFDKALSQQLAAKALSKAARARLEYTQIIAPSDGLIIRRDGEVGDLLTPQDKLFWIASDETPRVTVEVDEEDISLIKVGQTVLLRSDAFNSQIFDGVVSSITPKGDPITRSFRARISIADGTPLKFGMTIEANIITEKKDDALLIPTSFLIDQDNVRLKNKKITKVKVGIKGGQYTEILEGLSEGDTIIK